MADTLCLFIDETGQPNPLSPQSNTYILCGCCVPDSKRNEVKILADQIKFKYWGKTDINFHSADIARNAKDFQIFVDHPELKKDFTKDLLSFIQKAPIIVLAIVVDKALAMQRGWNTNKIIKETSKLLIKNFILLLHSRSGKQGKIIVESSTEKDPYYLNAFGYYSASGIEPLSIKAENVKEMITAISFVTKRNNDIETQITDLLAYGAKCKFEEQQKPIRDTYDKQILRVFNQKLYKIPEEIKKDKKKILKEISGFLIIP